MQVNYLLLTLETEKMTDNFRFLCLHTEEPPTPLITAGFKLQTARYLLANYSILCD